MPPTKAGKNGLVFQFEADPSQLVRALSRVTDDLGELEKAFVKTQRSSAKYIEDITKSLKELSTVSGRLPSVGKGLSSIFDAIDNLRVNQNKATYITGISSSLNKLTGPLQLLTTIKAGPAITNLGRLFDTVSSKVPTNSHIERLNNFSKALRNFNSASKGLAGLPPATLDALSATRNIPSGGAGDGSGGGTGGKGGTDAAGAAGAAALSKTSLISTATAVMAAVAPLWAMYKERTDVDEKLGTVANYNQGYFGFGGSAGSKELGGMLNLSSIRSGVSYRDTASLMASYRKYSAGGLYNTGMAELEGAASGKEGEVGRDFQGYVAGSRRLARQLNIDTDLAGDIQGSVRKSLVLTEKQFRSFGDSLTYLSKNAGMSQKEILELNKEIQTIGIITNQTGNDAVSFSQNMMAAGATLSKIGVGGTALSSISAGFSGDRTQYLLNKQMGISTAQTPTENLLRKKQHISMFLASIAGHAPEEQAQLYAMAQQGNIMDPAMSFDAAKKLAGADDAAIQKMIAQSQKEVKAEQAPPAMGMTSLLGSAWNIASTFAGSSLSKTVGPDSHMGILAALPFGAGAHIKTAASLIRDQYNYGSISEKKAAGGIVSGSGESDSVPAMLTPGEEVLRKDDPRHRDNIDLFSKSIARIEGYYAEGDSPNRPQRNYNPGNLRVDADWKNNPEKAMRVAKAQGAIGYDKGGYLKFADEAAGFAGLRRQIQIDAKRGLNVSQFISKYAPANENNTANYLAFMNKRGFNSSALLSDITGGSFERVAAPMQATSAATGGLLNRVSSTFSSVGNSITSFLGDLFDFSNNMSSTVSKAVQGNTAQVSASLLGASSSNNESADKISQAADVLLQAAQTMSSAVVSQASRGSEESRYRIASLARGNMVY